MIHDKYQTICENVLNLDNEVENWYCKWQILPKTLLLYRLRAASILLVGLNGYGAEVAKNIILAGVKSVTFLDHRVATALDTCSQFFIPRDKIGQNVSIFLFISLEYINISLSFITDIFFLESSSIIATSTKSESYGGSYC